MSFNTFASLYTTLNSLKLYSTYDDGNSADGGREVELLVFALKKINVADGRVTDRLFRRRARFIRSIEC